METKLMNLVKVMAAGCVCLAAVTAQSTPIFFNVFDAHPDNPTDTASQVGTALGEETLTSYFRWEGTSSFNSHITVTPGATGQATVSWDLTGTGYELEAIYVKGGSQGGNIYDISDTSADFEEVTGSGSVQTPTTGNNGNGGLAGISHIDFLVVSHPTPDGGTTVLLLGAAVSGLALLRRKLG